MINRYKVIYTDLATKQLSKMDKYVSSRIYKWVRKNLVNCADPFYIGKRLKGELSKFWRYRVGNYRILAEINNQDIVIVIVSIGHRKEIYD